MKLTKYAFVIFIFLLVSCSDDNNQNIDNQNNYAPGVVISFDDDYVDNWVEVHNLLKAYDWKATFFVTRFNQLSNDKIDKIKDLKNYGHEIGGHGLNHLNATTFIANNGVTEYLNQEIYPMINLMDNNSLPTTSFAYPNGARNTSIDNILFNDFEILRGTTYGNSNPPTQNCYYNGNRIVFGLGIDNSYPHFSISYFLSLLQYAKNNNKIVIFYAHKPVEKAQANYETEFETLIQICQFVKANNMKFYKISELYNL